VQFACDPANRPFFLIPQPVNCADLIWINDHRRFLSFDDLVYPLQGLPKQMVVLYKIMQRSPGKR
jgi:hypothetical protein